MSQSLASKLRRQLSSKNATKNATAIILFGAIALTFVFVGMPGNDGGMGVGYVARVNNSLISIADFQTQEKQISDQMSSLFGGQMPFGAQQNQFKQQAINQLVRFELANQAAQKERILATDSEIKDYITKDIPAFQENGQFQRERYSNYLASMRMNPGEFEAKLRKEVNNLRLLRLFEAANVDNKLSQEQANQMKAQKMNLQFLRIDREALAASRKASADEVSKNMAQDGFRKRVEDRFNLTKGKFDQAEQVHAQHILVMTKQGEASAETKALEKIKKIQSEVNPQNFAAMAQKHSDDPGSAKKGGDLGFFTKGKMDPEFEKVAFSLKPGEVSQPVKTEFGYHLIKVTDKKTAKTAALADHQNQIASQILAEDQLDKDIKALQEAVSGGNYDEVAKFQKDWNVNWQETGFFDMSQDSIAQLPVEDLGFVAGLTKEKPWGAKVVSGRGGESYIVKLKDSKTDALPATAVADAGPEGRRQKSFGFYDGFIRQFEKQSTIQVNQKVLQ
ncbi:MAG: SurA N-terminal domain-containing protein [Bdellovibrionota bacterium]